MAKATIRFNSEKAARGFAERTGGVFKECHSKESSNFKVRVSGVEKHSKTSNNQSTNNDNQPSQLPDGAFGSQYDYYGWEGDDF